MTHETTRVQDNDGHWYWIPNDKFLQFNKDLEAITGIEYMDNPDAFDKFNDTYGIYETGGAPDLKPDVFKEKEFVVQGGREQLEAFHHACKSLIEKHEVRFKKVLSSQFSDDNSSSLQDIVKQLESCNYECEAGSLSKNTAFIALKKESEKGINFCPTKSYDSVKIKQPFLNDEIGQFTKVAELINSRGVMFRDSTSDAVNLKWKYTANGDIPVPEPNVNYSLVPCLVVRKENNYSEILYHNDKEGNWDGPDKDDYECEFLEVEKWISLTEIERFLEK